MRSLRFLYPVVILLPVAGTMLAEGEREKVPPACLVFTGTSFLVHQAPAEQPTQAQAKAGSEAGNQGGSAAWRRGSAHTLACLP
jgi:hypothetical protein